MKGESFTQSSLIINSILDKMHYKRFILAISHSDYLTNLGGTEKFIQAEEAMFKEEKISYIQIFPLKTPNLHLSNQYVGVNIDSIPAGYFSIFQLGYLLGLLQNNNLIDQMATHIHHLLNFSFSAVEYLLNHCHAREIRFYLHDYYSICPQFNLLLNDKEYCRITKNSSLCNRCCWGKEKASHDQLIQNLFKGREISFISPSENTKEIWGKNHPDLLDRIIIYPHQIIDTGTKIQDRPENNKIRIAFIGYQQSNKGWNVWKKLVNGTNHNHFEFFHLGSAYKKINKVSLVPISFINDGHESMIKSLMEYNIDIAFLWSIWPETYSFTFFESLMAGCFVITNKNSGNIAAQVKKYSNGIAFDTEPDLFNFFQNHDQVTKVLIEFQKSRSTYQMEFNPSIVKRTLDLSPNKSREKPKSNINIDELFSGSGNIELLNKLEDEIRSVRNIFEEEKKYQIWHSHLIKRPFIGLIAKIAFKIFKPFPELRRQIKRNKLFQLIFKV